MLRTLLTARRVGEKGRRKEGAAGWLLGDGWLLGALRVLFNWLGGTGIEEKGEGAGRILYRRLGVASVVVWSAGGESEEEKEEGVEEWLLIKLALLHRLVLYVLVVVESFRLAPRLRSRVKL